MIHNILRKTQECPSFHFSSLSTMNPVSLPPLCVTEYVVKALVRPNFV